MKAGENEYLKRLKPFAKVEVVHIKDEKSMKLGTGQLIVLDESGKEMSSKEFAGFLEKFKDSGETVTFVIGDAYGLSEDFKKKAKLLFSLSKMTFTHQMVKLFLLEQIYRGLSIILGKEYHND